MTPTKIITPTQLLFLDLFSDSSLTKDFYLSGGTALTGFYFPYRYSEDLDFFSKNEFDIQTILVFLKSIKNRIKYLELDINTTFNRNLVFLKFSDHTLKTEFTHYPFPQDTPPNKYKKISIDSLTDIAINKLFTIYQKPRSRDFMDLYMICKKEKLTITDLIKKAKIKFDWHIDPLKFGSQLLLCKDIKDFPNLVNNLKESDWQSFFLNEANKLAPQILDHDLRIAEAVDVQNQKKINSEIKKSRSK